jgi:hypothetical protein
VISCLDVRFAIVMVMFGRDLEVPRQPGDESDGEPITATPS